MMPDLLALFDRAVGQVNVDRIGTLIDSHAHVFAPSIAIDELETEYRVAPLHWPIYSNATNAIRFSKRRSANRSADQWVTVSIAHRLVYVPNADRELALSCGACWFDVALG